MFFLKKPSLVNTANTMETDSLPVYKMILLQVLTTSGHISSQSDQVHHGHPGRGILLNKNIYMK